MTKVPKSLDWDAINATADWVVDLQSGTHTAPEALIEAAIKAGTRYLTEPTDENKNAVDDLAAQLADHEKGSAETRENARDD